VVTPHHPPSTLCTPDLLEQRTTFQDQDRAKVQANRDVSRGMRLRHAHLKRRDEGRAAFGARASPRHVRPLCTGRSFGVDRAYCPG